MSFKRWINFYFASTVHLTGRRLYVEAFVICYCLLVILGTASADLFELGEPPRFPETLSELPTLDSYKGISPASSGFSLDPTSRAASREFFNTYYKASEGHAIGWTGNQATCNAGETAVDFRDAVLLRLNYFRAMAGVPSGTVFSDIYSGKAQDAALMMSVNSSLSHNPPTSWQCYSAAGAEAAGRSNLCLGMSGWDAITAYMEDSGSQNYFAGHRRWILYPQTQTMGAGDVPFGSGYWASNALWAYDSNIFGPRPSTREEFVSWPPPGYVPYQVVFPRWSFSYPSADFSAATVTMVSEGANISVGVAAISNGYGENTIVWIPNHMNDGDIWPKPNKDTVFSVVIANVRIGGTPHEFQYAVAVFDPDAEDTMSPSLSITSHTDGQHVSTSTITLTGTASDAGNGDNGIQQVTVNGSRAYNDMALGNGTANWSRGVTIYPGANTITVIAYDNSSNHNVTTQSLTIYCDADTIFVSTDDNHCNGNIPCLPNIQNGIAWASASSVPSIIEITKETYNGDIILNFDEVIALRGGWNTGFTANSSSTTIQGSITISNGTMIPENIIVR